MNYEHRIVAFIDILAFADRIKNTQYTNKAKKVFDKEDSIAELFEIFNRIRFLMGVTEPSDDVPESRRVSQFSDSIFISFDPKDEPREFKYLLGELLYLHIELAKHNILIRGGISYGPMIHTNEIIFGPALVQAYQLESKAAISPRIILPQSLYKKDSEFNDLITAVKVSNNLDELISIDEDDFFYLDYFDKCQNPYLGLFVEDKEYIEYLKNLQTLIVEGLKIDKPDIYSKYGWMKTKWNNTILKYQSNKEQDDLILSDRIELAKYFKNELLIETSM